VCAHLAGMSTSPLKSKPPYADIYIWSPGRSPHPNSLEFRPLTSTRILVGLNARSRRPENRSSFYRDVEVRSYILTPSQARTQKVVRYDRDSGTQSAKLADGTLGHDDRTDMAVGTHVSNQSS
jgi:hypothetical protein